METRRSKRNQAQETTEDRDRHLRDLSATPDRESESDSPRTLQYNYGTALSDYSPSTPHQIRLHKGDVVTNVERISKSLYQGTNARTEQTGVFLAKLIKLGPTRHLSQEDDLLAPDYVPECRVPPSTGTRKAGRRGSWLFLSIVLVAVIGVLVFHLFVPRGSIEGTRDVFELRKRFKSQDPKMWKTLHYALMPSRTELVQTYVFLHNNRRTAECLIKHLSYNNCTEYDARDITFEDAFVSKIIREMETQEKCLVIMNLERLSPDGVIVLKGLCDAYTPIVRDAQFFFALDVGNKLYEGEPGELIRQVLAAEWSTRLSPDEFEGTLTRLSQNVMKLTTEYFPPC